MTSHLFPLYSLDGSSTKPLGMAMCQNRLAVPTWSYAMEVLPPATIVELGTYSGGLTVALGVHAYNLEPRARITTYERSRAPDERFAALGKFLGINFRAEVDIWACEAEIAALIRAPGTCYVLCDGGDKPRELALFARYLKSGDVIASHDYHEPGAKQYDGSPAWAWAEVSAAHGQVVADANDLAPWMQEHFDMAGWLTYRKRVPGPGGEPNQGPAGEANQPRGRSGDQ